MDKKRIKTFCVSPLPQYKFEEYEQHSLIYIIDPAL